MIFMNFKNFKKLIESSGVEETKLFEKAQIIKKEKFGNKLFLRATIEISNICENTCHFCGMSNSNKSLTRYAIPLEEICLLIDRIELLKIGHIHFVSGESKTDYTLLRKIIKYAKDKNIYTTGVFGMLPKDEIQILKILGLDRYILKFETSNERLFNKYKPEISFSERVDYINYLKKMNFKTGSGNIIGLPETTIEDYFNDLKLLKKLRVDMASSSLFFPNKFSKLKDCKRGSLELLLKYIAIMRINLIDPAPVIPISSSLGQEALERGILAGGNLVSIPFTPKLFQEKFSLYYDENNERIQQNMKEILKICKNNKLEISIYE